MKIHGWNKVTLLDYPETLASTLFLGHCNFRCPFCQNGGLVLRPEQEPEISKEEIFRFLKKRRGILEGVCITGGEPTLHKELPELIGEIKKLGYKVKLDTNGSRPEVVKQLVESHLIDYVAMDIKNSPEKYAATAGLASLDLEQVKETVAYLMQGHVDWEFRTTVVRQLHTKEDFEAIGQWISGAKRYYLQNFRGSDDVICPGFTSYTKKEMEEFRQILKKYLSHVELRGMD